MEEMVRVVEISVVEVVVIFIVMIEVMVIFVFEVEAEEGTAAVVVWVVCVVWRAVVVWTVAVGLSVYGAATERHHRNHRHIGQTRNHRCTQ